MAVFIISYDLRQPGQNYPNLIPALSKMTACRCLQSVWLIEANMTSQALHNVIKAYMDQNDGLIVCEVVEHSPAGWWASGLLNRCADWLLQRRP